jgi:hypothetical protein
VEEIAEVLELNANTVKVRLFRARQNREQGPQARRMSGGGSAKFTRVIYSWAQS